MSTFFPYTPPCYWCREPITLPDKLRELPGHFMPYANGDHWLYRTFTVPVHDRCIDLMPHPRQTRESAI